MTVWLYQVLVFPQGFMLAGKILKLEISLFLIPETAVLRQALQAIDANAMGVCFVVDSGGVLRGLLTDGDVRRAILSGAQLDDPVSRFMRKDFVSLEVGAANEVIQAKLSDRIRVIPLLDSKRRPVDVATLGSYRRIPVLEPSLSGNELAYVTECIRTHWISSQGPYVKKFEDLFKKSCEMEHALAVSNGTVALHLALEALGVGPGDEVIVPDLTFAASANAVVHSGATPVFVDVEDSTGCLDVAKAREAVSPKTRAIMPVHLYGYSCDMDAVMALAREQNLLVVEDCAEAIGTRWKGKPVGSFGDASCFSFFGNKTITTGEGGMVLFRDEQIRERGAVLRDHGMNKNRRYWHEVVGYNYRLTNLQAAIGVAQMERLDYFVETKRKIAARYREGLTGLQGVTLAPESADCLNSYWLYTIRIGASSRLTRDQLQSVLMDAGVETRPVFHPMHVMPAYREYQPKRSCAVSVEFSKQGLSLPSSVGLSVKEQDRVVSQIRKALGA